MLLAIDVRNTHTVVGLLSGPNSTQKSCSNGGYGPNPKSPPMNWH
ncbi:type III pantothenate kinase domain protein [Mycobacterium ulcerans str. Harvey]|uniref:Type III pantothenate kinase domain protein n=1 Tax=Mycobacterium ulcerans str. Harvey TaxID=1299332 RepID=A0ABN0QQ68_MYCUL|nr:type III pantothenate kinase domain protein [Mycobacterium ulcerans str. Harvey]